MRTTTVTLFYSSQMITPRNPTPSREAFTPSSAVQLSPWHSPVPYLFGGLAATMGLIAFALLLLACSYWKLPGEGNNGEANSNESDVEGGTAAAEKCRNGSDTEAAAAFEEKFLVIMAGDVKPTFLATPTSINHDKSRNDENQTEIKSQENSQESSSSSQEQNQI